MAQLDEREFILNFQLAAGMGLSLNTYATTPFIQYAIYNEGLRGKAGATAVWKLNWTKGIGKRLGTIGYEDLAPLDADSPYDTVKGIIAVDNTSAFIAPEGADITGIPKILDAMNPGIVRVWSFDVDTADSAIGSMTVAARSAMESSKVQFIE